MTYTNKSMKINYQRMAYRITRGLFIFFSVFHFLGVKAQLSFTENKGQWDQRVLFQSEAGNSTFFLQKDGYTILMQHPDDYSRAFEYYHGHKHEPASSKTTVNEGLPGQFRAHAYKVKFLRANANPQIVKEKPLPGYENYFIGDDPSKWASGCRSYQAVTYKNLYPGIDLRYYVQGTQLKYDLIVYPGADLSKVQLQYDGTDRLKIRDQELTIETSVGSVRELKPFTFQYQEEGRRTIPCKYKLSGNVLSFEVKEYDHSKTLIVDPVVIFSSFSRASTDNWGFTATPGPDGSMYGAGIAQPSGFPVSPGAISGGGSGPANSNTPPDIGIIRLSPDGRTRIYATYLGGSNYEQPHSLICDAAGNLVIAGRTNSANFPSTAPFAGTPGGYDIFVTKINASGTAIIGSIRMGGRGDDGVNISSNRNNGPQTLLRNYGDDGRSEVIIDASGNILLASCTRSNDFFIKGAFQTTFGGGQDGVVIKLNNNVNTVLWSTYFGGTGDDAAFVLSENPLSNGSIYVGGGTTSPGLLGAGSGAFQPVYNGGVADGFVSRLQDNGTTVTIIKSIYLGTTGTDLVYGVQFDSKGFPYVMGTTTGNWPVVNATYSGSNARQFIAKLQPDLTGFVYSTTFGSPNASAPNISPVAFLVDNCENVYVSGWGGGANSFANPQYPTAGTFNMPVTPDAFQSATDGSDFYFFVLKKNASAQLYGSFFGQRGGDGGWDHVDGGTSRFDSKGVIYQALCANCKNVPSGQPLISPYPVSAGAYGNINPAATGGGCNLGMVKIRFDFSGVDVSLRAVGSRQLNFCLPARVQFVDTLKQAKQYIWIWNDGTKNDTTTSNPFTHTFTRTGFFDVKLIGIDSNTCNVKDSAFMRIRVTADSVAVKFSSKRLPPCTGLTYEFTNESDRLSSIPNFSSNSFVWIWGDGSKNDTSGIAPPVLHTFPSPGSYNVRLVLIDSNFCNVSDTFKVMSFQVASTIRAGFSAGNGCIPYRLSVRDSSFGAVTYKWVSNDGQVSTDPLPDFTYTIPGTYSVKQYIYNPSSCNLEDSVVQSFQVYGPPRAGFIYTPNPSKENTPTQFLNRASGDVVKWIWDFGDNTTSNETNPIHQYIRPGINNVCQIVFNAQGCSDTVCTSVESIINKLNELPTAFTPNGDGSNDIFRVRGFGISKMIFRIYNRQGLLLFESRSFDIGWDGTYKGVPQPMDAYAWTLEAEYFTGEKIRKKGDVTLIR